MGESIFTRIIRGELPSHKVWEDADFFAFLDINPIQRGHMLLVPKKEVDSIWDLDEATYAALWSRVRKLAPPLCKAIGAVRTGIVVEGLAVPHVHVHLIPINKTADIDPHHQKKATPEELAPIAETIRKAFAEAGV